MAQLPPFPLVGLPQEVVPDEPARPGMASPQTPSEHDDLPLLNHKQPIVMEDIVPPTASEVEAQIEERLCGVTSHIS